MGAMGMGMPMDAGMPMGPPPSPISMMAMQLEQALAGEQAKVAGAEQVATEGLMMALEAFMMPPAPFAEGAPLPPMGAPPMGAAPMDPMMGGMPPADPMMAAMAGF